MSTLSHADEAAFVAAIRDNPGDALPRLIFADWLDEHGRAAEAAWLRADVRLAQTYPATDPDDLRTVESGRPPEGVPPLLLGHALRDVVQTFAALFLVLGQPLQAAFRALAAAARNAEGREAAG
jgi:uncharacterized protein (TIGR02996 family)